VAIILIFGFGGSFEAHSSFLFLSTATLPEPADVPQTTERKATSSTYESWKAAVTCFTVLDET
jgi:hypothetical protein